MFFEMPAGFRKGAATSARQIEGAHGRGPCNWKHFLASRLGPHEVDWAEVACGHYHHWAADVDLMKQMGLGTYRFSISWPRLQPEGKGPLNNAGVDFYERLIDRLLEKGIEPWLTLYHWELPLLLHQQGGWLRRETAKRFADFVELIARKLGDRVKKCLTINEPGIIAFMGHIEGEFAPGERNWHRDLRVAHHLLLGHGLAMTALRHTIPDCQAGIVQHLCQVERLAGVDTMQARFGEWKWWLFGARWFLEPVLLGRYPPLANALYHSLLPVLRPGDMEIISQKMDFMGVNYYLRQGIGPRGEWVKNPPGSQQTAMDWEVCAPGLERLLLRLRHNYPNLPPIYITESGAAFDDVLQDSRVEDNKRLVYHREHLAAVWRAIQAGVDVRGYFAWALMDNIEWPNNRKRFGLVHVDYDHPALTRTIKDSGHWYAQFCAQNGFADELRD